MGDFSIFAIPSARVANHWSKKVRLFCNFISDVFYIINSYNINMKYRSRTEIVGRILKVASQGATKTKIMYDAYLSYTQLTEYLRFLTDNKMIKRNEGTEIYRLTEKGQRFYQKCKEIDEMISSKPTHTSAFEM